jgi:hypothetical protein
MTNEERDLITQFIERIAGGPTPVPGQPAPAALPPIDREADALIGGLFTRYPDVRYRITQMAFVQEHALVEAQNRIARLQWELQQARQTAPAAPPAGSSPWGAAAGAAATAQPSRGLFSSLFGGGNTAPRAAAPPPYAAPPPQYAPPPPQYPQNYNPGLFQQQGSGFLGSALRTAAGVAGGVLAADAISSMFSGHQGLGGGGGWGIGSAQAAEAVPGVAANPWAASQGTGPDPYDVGGAPKEPLESDKFAGPADVDQSAWTPVPDQSDNASGWTDASNAGWQDAPPADPDPGTGGWDQAADDSGGGWDDGSQDV